MKRILRHYIVVTFSLWEVSRIADGLIFENGEKTFLLAGLGFMLASLFAKPIINILLLPINLVTFGLFRWVSSAVVLYLVVLIVPNFKLESFHFTAYHSKWIDLPTMNLEGLLAYVAFAFLLSFITSFIFWVIK